MNAYLELIRAPAAVTVVGDTLVGMAAAHRPDRAAPARAAWLMPVSSVLLYSAGMALNDYGDRELDAVERPERPIPSGRVSAGRALALAATLTVAGVAVAALAHPRTLRVSVPLVASIWAYDTIAKDSPAGPPVMGLCRALDVLMGASVTPGSLRHSAGPAAAIGTHTLAVTVLSRGEVHGADPVVPAAATALSAAVATGIAVVALKSGRSTAERTVVAAALGLFGMTATRAGVRAATKPAPAAIRAAVRAGIGGLVPVQGALLAVTGRPRPGASLLLAGLAAVLLGRRSEGDIT